MVVAKLKPPHILLIFGTRPEAIKLAPVFRALQAAVPVFNPRVVVTAQHRGMLDQVLAQWHIRPDVDLNLMQPGQSLAGLSSLVLTNCTRILERMKPDLVMVQGDTATTLAAALAAFYKRIPIAHVEAGLRTNDLANPFPEEANRRMVSVLATWHFAATAGARVNLLNEGIPSRQIFVTGNPVVDALYSVLQPDFKLADWLTAQGQVQRQQLVVVTAHRRENFGEPMQEICQALAVLCRKFPDVNFVFPVHPNPQVQRCVKRWLRIRPANLLLLEPLPYDVFINVISCADLILTDSGGIQEEAPALGRRALVMRVVTERPEALSAGVELVLPRQRLLIARVTAHLHTATRRLGVAPCPFGDGQASGRIVAALQWIFGQRQARPLAFRPIRRKTS